MMDRQFLRYILVTGILLAALYAVGMIHPSGIAWGFHFFGFLPPIWFAGYLLLSIGAALFAVRVKEDELSSLAQSAERRPAVYLGIVLLLFADAAFLFRIRAPLLGDSFTLIKNFTDAQTGAAPLAPWHEPLSVFTLYHFVRLFGSLGYPHVAWSFLFVQIILGAGFILTAYLIVQRLFAAPVERFLVFSFLLVLPYMEYFFGYVETYSVSTLVLAIFILCSLLVVQRKLSFVVLPVCWLAVTFSHYINGLLGVSVLYLALREYRERRYKSLAAGLGLAAAALLVVLWSVNFTPSALIDEGPISHFLSLTPAVSLFNAYSQAFTIFSFYHVVDLANYLILMAPFPVVLLIMLFFRHRKEWTFADRTHLWFVLALGPLALYLLLAKLEQGTANDWDVFAAQFFLFALYVSYLYFRHTPAGGERLFLLIVFFSLLNSSAWFSVNAGRDSAIRRFSSLWDKRILSQLGRYTMALRLTRFYDAEGDSLKVIDVWGRYLRDYPGDPRGYANAIDDLKARAPGEVGRRMALYDAWMTVDPANDSLRQAYIDDCVDAGNRLYSQGQLDEAAECYGRALAKDSTLPRAMNNLGSVYAEKGDLARAISLFEKAASLDSTYGEAYANLGTAFLDRHERERAADYFRHAARLGVKRADQMLDSLRMGR